MFLFLSQCLRLFYVLCFYVRLTFLWTLLWIDRWITAYLRHNLLPTAVQLCQMRRASF